MDIIVKKPTEDERQMMQTCPIWECEPSVFDWSYDQQETCLLIDGEVTVKYGDNSVSFAKGDFVIFPKGLFCNWNVKKAVKKYYMFS